MKKLKLAVAISMAFTIGQANADLLQDARSGFGQVSGYFNSAKNKPVVDSWGDPINQNSVQVKKVQTRKSESEWGSSAEVDEPATNQPAIKRVETKSERQNPAYYQKIVDKPKRQELKPKAEVATQPAPQSKGLDFAEYRVDFNKSDVVEDVQVKYSAPEKQVLKLDSGCDDANKSLAVIKNLIKINKTDEAYAGYMDLLSSCRQSQLMSIVVHAKDNLSKSQFQVLVEEPVFSAPKLSSVIKFINFNKLYSLNDSGNYEQALSFSREIREDIINSSEAGVLIVSGWLEQKSKNFKEAEKLFKQAIYVSKGDIGAREGLAIAYLAQGMLTEAEQEVQKMGKQAKGSIKGEILLAKARNAIAEGSGESAMAFLAQAEQLGLKLDNDVLAAQGWALRLTGKLAESKKIFQSLARKYPDNEEYQKGLTEALIDSKDVSGLEEVKKSLKGESLSRVNEVLGGVYLTQGRFGKAAETLGTTPDQLKSKVTTALTTSAKSGDVGEEKLSKAVLTNKASIQVSDRTNLTIQNDIASLSDSDRKVRLNTSSIQLSYEGDSAEIKVKAGMTTPKAGKGVAVTTGTVIGDASLTAFNGADKTTIGLKRHVVADSVRSAVGSADGKTGAAVSNSIYLNGKSSLEDQSYKLTYSGEVGSISGKGLMSNQFVNGKLGFRKEFSKEGWSWLSLGPEIAIAGNSSDNNRFKDGYGGYYSPISQVDLGVSADALSDEGKQNIYKISGKTGLSKKSFYNGSSSGMYLEGSVDSAWVLNPYLTLGAGLSLKSSQGYSDVGARAWLSVPFESKKKLYADDLSWKPEL